MKNYHRLLYSAFIATFFLLTITSSYSQTPIDIAENNIKIEPDNQSFQYYGLCKGDQLIFNMQVADDKDLKEVEIKGPSSSSMFLDYKTKKIENKIISIPETGIYQIRFYNSNIISGRVCRFKVQRIPSSEETKGFNSIVYKQSVYDTTYFQALDTVPKRDTTVTEIVNTVVKVHSSTNLNSNKSSYNFSLPLNTVAWSYYIGVDQSGQQAYADATEQLIANSTPLITKLVGTSPLGALALGIPSYLSKIQAGEDIDFYLIPSEYAGFNFSEAGYRYYRKSKVLNAFEKMAPLPGNLTFSFINDNALLGVTVLLKVTALQVRNSYEVRQVKKMAVKSRIQLYLKN